MLTTLFASLILIVLTCSTVLAQSNRPDTKTTEQEIIAMEKKWGDTIQRRDVAQMDQFLADTYFLAIGVQGQKLQIVPRSVWLATLKDYITHSYSIDDIKVNVYGDTAVVMMLYTQKATVGVPPRDRSAQFVITDIWIKTKKGWRVAERHSSRPEPQPASQSK